eukprot:g6931.t1
MSLGFSIAAWFWPIMIITLPPSVRLEPGVEALIYWNKRCWNKASVQVHSYDGYSQQTNTYSGCSSLTPGGKAKVAMVALIIAQVVLGLAVLAGCCAWRQHCMVGSCVLCSSLLALAAIFLALHKEDHRNMHAEALEWGFDDGGAVLALALGSASAFGSAWAVERLG